MEKKELKIIPPEGYEIDKENSTFECIKFKPKRLTYGNVVRTLFEKRPYYYHISPAGTICIKSGYSIDPNSATSQKQLEKLLAINKLMNVAKYLNGDWKPDWDDYEESKFYIFIDCDRAINIACCFSCPHTSVYFKTEDLAQQAIDILGEDTIRLALSTDW